MRLTRWLAVLFPFSIAGTIWGQGYLVPPQGFQGAPAVPAMGNVSPPTSQRGNQVDNQTIGRINDAANGQLENSQNPNQPNANGNTSANAEANAPTEGEGMTTPLAAPVESIAQWGAVHTHLHAAYLFLYSTGVHSAPGVATDTYTHTISPGITLNLGPHVMVDYTAGIRFFSQKDFHNTVDHSASLSAGVHYGDWTFGTSQSLAITDEPLVETSGQTGTTSYAGGLAATYSASDRLSLTTSAGVALMFVDQNSVVVTNGGGGIPIPPHNFLGPLSDSQSYTGGERLNYAFSDKISGGLGVSVGYTEQQNGGFRSISATYDGNVTWHPVKKLSASVSGGVQQNSFLDTDAKDLWSPVYAASVVYSPFEQTSLSLYANRGTSSSLFANQITESTSVGVGFQQRLLGHLHLSLGFGYTSTDYRQVTSNLATSRSDSGTSYSVGLGLPFLKRFSASAFYQYSQNNSSAGGFGYSSSQAGATLSWAY
jgi:hypothetical protein